MDYVKYEEFKKMDIRVGTIREIEAVPETDKLLKCQVDFGPSFFPPALKTSEGQSKAMEGEGNNNSLIQIISGIKEYYPDPQVLIGKQVLYIVNLEPRTIKGFESNGMLMAVDGLDGRPIFLIPEFEVPPGSRVH